MTRTLLNIGYCAEHFKGGDRINRLPGQEHAEWLEQAVDLYLRIIPDDWAVCVSCTGFHGMLNVENAPGNCERDVMWRIAGKCMILGVTQNPGHQQGAALCIRQGLECASKLGYTYMVQTAEDVIPGEGIWRGDGGKRSNILADMNHAIYLGRADYVGSLWGPNRDELDSCFFACRVEPLVSRFDPASCVPYLERYLASLVTGKRVEFSGHYRTTHDHSEWTRWAKELHP